MRSKVIQNQNEELTPQWHNPTTSHIHCTWIFSFHPLWNHVWHFGHLRESNHQICSRWDELTRDWHDSSANARFIERLRSWDLGAQPMRFTRSSPVKKNLDKLSDTELGNRWLWPQCQISKNKIQACKATKTVVFFEIHTQECQRKETHAHEHGTQSPPTEYSANVEKKHFDYLAELAFICWSTSSASEEFIAVMRFSAACQANRITRSVRDVIETRDWHLRSKKESSRIWDREIWGPKPKNEPWYSHVGVRHVSPPRST